MSYYCKKCGNHNKYESRACIVCGTQSPAEKPKAVKAPVKKKPGKK